jgi:hypothetical protein
MENSSMSLISKHWSKLAFLIFLLLWQGLPAFNKWRADKLVDELCAKDGGIKVYETVTLPKERFNEWGQFQVSDRRYIKPADEYYTEHTNIYYKNGIPINDDSHKDEAMEVWQFHYKLYRKIDNKLLGESIGYSRRGGDPVGPWHMSSYHCPENDNLEKQIFFVKN